MSALTDTQLQVVNAYLDQRASAWNARALPPLITGKVLATAKAIVHHLSIEEAVDEASAALFDIGEVEREPYASRPSTAFSASAWLAAAEYVGGAANDSYGYHTGQLALIATNWLEGWLVRRCALAKEPNGRWSSVGVLLDKSFVSGLVIDEMERAVQAGAVGGRSWSLRLVNDLEVFE